MSDIQNLKIIQIIQEEHVTYVRVYSWDKKYKSSKHRISLFGILSEETMPVGQIVKFLIYL